jgi:hypothetical protein
VPSGVDKEIKHQANDNNYHEDMDVEEKAVVEGQDGKLVMPLVFHFIIAKYFYWAVGLEFLLLVAKMLAIMNRCLARRCLWP